MSGGHSGKDIAENRGNPIVELGSLLKKFNQNEDLYINSIEGGTWVTSIPREVECTVTMHQLDSKKTDELFVLLTEFLQKKYTNNNISASIKKMNTSTLAFDKETTNKVIQYISNFPAGSILKNEKTNDTIFSANLGTIFVEDESIYIENSIRSNLTPNITSQLIEKLKKEETSNGFNTIGTYDFPRIFTRYRI